MQYIEPDNFELAVLIQTQAQAIETSPYLRMTRASQLEYNERRKRIETLRETLGKKNGSKTSGAK